MGFETQNVEYKYIPTAVSTKAFYRERFKNYNEGEETVFHTPCDNYFYIHNCGI